MTPDDVKCLFVGLLYEGRDLERMRHRVEALKSPTISSGIVRAVEGGKTDRTADAGCALADEGDVLAKAEARYRRRLEEAEELIDGVRRGMGNAYGDILEDRYVRGLTALVVAKLNGMTRSSVYRYVDTACDAIASVGLQRAKMGDFALLSGTP